MVTVSSIRRILLAFSCIGTIGCSNSEDDSDLAGASTEGGTDAGGDGGTLEVDDGLETHGTGGAQTSVTSDTSNTSSTGDTGGTGNTGNTGNADSTNGNVDDGTDSSDTGTMPPGGQILVTDTESLREALLNAVPGDHISVAPGTYAAPDFTSLDYADAVRTLYFYSRANGTATDPITIESQDPNRKAELVGIDTSDSVYILWINGEHWIIRDLILRTGGKGLMLDEASHSIVSGVEVYDVGDEAIHLRSGTSDTLVENCLVDGTGSVQPGFGEGVYIGSDNSQWDFYNEATNNNTVRGCTIRNVTAEGIDVKEGTTNTLIEDCEVYGGAISGENFADSFIDLKGDGAHVRSCDFYKENNSTLTRGVAIVERPKGPTATNNWISDNEFHMNNADGFMVHAYAGADNHAWNNNRSPAGDEYNGNAPELYLTDPQ